MALDPWIEEHLPLLRAMDDLGGFATPEGRTKWNAFFAPPVSYAAPSVDVEELPYSRRDTTEGRIRVYRPRDAPGSGAGLVWMHGGGFTGGDLDMFEADGVSRELASRAGATIVSVDYRLVDEHTIYPTPVHDVLDAFAWAGDNAAQLGIRAEALGIGGASAGSVLAMAAVLTLRDSGDRVPAFTVLAYPTMHPVLPPLSHELAAKLEVVPRILDYRPRPGKVFENPTLRALLGGPEWLATAHSTPGLAELHDLPRTLIVNSEYDALRASGQLFAAQLAQAGVDVAVRQERGVMHGHLNMAPFIPGVDASLSTIADFLR